MEEPKAPSASASASAPQLPSDPPTTQTQAQAQAHAPQPPLPAATTTSTTTTTHPPHPSSVPTTTKKRPLESHHHDANSNYFKIRAIVRDLRPRFIEVLRTPDYKNCKASQEIREQLKIVIKLYDDMKVDAASLVKPKQDGLPPSCQNLDHKTQPEQQPQHVKSAEQIQVEKSFAKSSEMKVAAQAPGLQKLPAEDGQGTYVVGGSAFGWNFITFSGKEAVYYGRTREQFRSSQVTQ